MNEEAQRIAIATHCGIEPVMTWRKNESGVELVAVPGSEDWSDAPEYLHDLNAMHEAEKTLDPHVRNDFIAHLWSVTGNMPSANFWTEYNFRGLYACTHATAAQRAEAFLRTIGKWEDGK